MGQLYFSVDYQDRPEVKVAVVKVKVAHLELP